MVRGRMHTCCSCIQFLGHDPSLEFVYSKQILEVVQFHSLSHFLNKTIAIAGNEILCIIFFSVCCRNHMVASIQAVTSDTLTPPLEENI